jgi:hypothetical protein
MGVSMNPSLTPSTTVGHMPSPVASSERIDTMRRRLDSRMAALTLS